ncbi:MAG TPA: LssY C-terminal domain-containing protein [Steroidobacteraceae bacterium]|nr:LssY C-terminal domain-containing protein [Steroidobacteraceae bacterium]
MQMQTQSHDAPEAGATPAGSRRRRRRRAILVGLVVWAIAAYLVAPRLWTWYLERTKPLPDVARVTHTSDGHPGDPVNIALEGSKEEVIKAMTAAGWYPADPVTLSSSVRIAVDTALRRADDMAPVSPLYLFGRVQDLAFEQPVPGGPRHRHHVRYWLWDQQRDGSPVWFGAVTYDERAGLSYTTGEVTHHIGSDVDAERDRVVAELTNAGWVGGVQWIDDFHRQLEGRNGGGDLWRTDGRLAVARLAARPSVR